MKIAMTDGCANGGMMDSLTMSPAKKYDAHVVDVTEEKWQEWQAFLKVHGEWEHFWDRKLMEAYGEK